MARRGRERREEQRGRDQPEAAPAVVMEGGVAADPGDHHDEEGDGVEQEDAPARGEQAIPEVRNARTERSLSGEVRAIRPASFGRRGIGEEVDWRRSARAPPSQLPVSLLARGEEDRPVQLAQHRPTAGGWHVHQQPARARAHHRDRAVGPAGLAPVVVVLGVPAKPCRKGRRGVEGDRARLWQIVGES